MAEYPDATVRAIRDALQRGRFPFTELARRVGLGASATTERVRRLDRGVITGCRAEADLGKAGCPVLAVVSRYTEAATCPCTGCSASARRPWSAWAPRGRGAAC
ncbi:Lrp/AsnC family transcriptional regulator [Actinacidiphila glaucinigra]|uniref:Lrp/AsnC family transcriptional regulator n=1 Tax=Actinacidiphila glaucinigra TaxID=235986 RepID=UPI0037A14355